MISAYSKKLVLKKQWSSTPLLVLKVAQSLKLWDLQPLIKLKLNT
jgi:hypothetical protein